MKKLMYLLVAALMVTFTACGGAEEAATEAPATEEAATEEAATEETVAEEVVV